MDPRLFFRRPVRFSIWLWLGALDVILIAAVTIFVFHRMPPSWGGQIYCLLGILVALVLLGRSINDYNSIQLLELDWSSIESGTPLHETLQVAARQISYSFYASVFIPLAMLVGAVHRV